MQKPDTKAIRGELVTPIRMDVDALVSATQADANTIEDLCDYIDSLDSRCPKQLVGTEDGKPVDRPLHETNCVCTAVSVAQIREFVLAYNHSGKHKGSPYQQSLAILDFIDNGPKRNAVNIVRDALTDPFGDPERTDSRIVEALRDAGLLKEDS